MIRDTFFSWHRFVNVCRKEMVEGWKANLLRVILMYGMLAIVLVWNAYIEYSPYDTAEGIARGVWSFGVFAFIWGIVIMGCLSASFTMERMKTKTNRMSMLMTPATMFEKFFARWLVFTFGFLLVYLIAYKLADWTRVLLFMVQYPEVGPVSQVPLYACLTGNEPSVLSSAFDEGRSISTGLSGYFLLQSCFVLGSSIWPRNAFLKTFTAGVCIVIVYTLVGGMLVKLLFTGRGYSTISEETVKSLVTLFFILMTLFNWVMAYFRFKESEIINRW